MKFKQAMIRGFLLVLSVILLIVPFLFGIGFVIWCIDMLMEGNWWGAPLMLVGVSFYAGWFIFVESL